MKKFLYGLLAVLFVLPMGFLFAACSKTYTVKYYVDGQVYQTVEFKTGQTVPTVENPEKVGYTFEGWFLENSISGDEFFNFDDIIDGNVNLYAQFRKNQYTITYNLDNGTNDADNPETFEVDTADITLKNATKLGYVFAGWYDNANFQGNAVTTIARGTHQNIELYAKFVVENYAITYELDGGVQNNQNQNGYNVETELNLYNPTKVGYTFDGWFDNVNFQGEAITNIPAGSTGNKTLYAKWTINQYTITFDTKCDVVVDSITADYNANIDKPTDPQWLGYTFTGWYQGTTEFEFPEGHASMPLGGAALEAHWTAVDYTITYNNLQGATNPNPATYTIDDATITLQDADRIGYDFEGWYDNDQCTGEKVTTIAAGSTGNKTLWANWTESVYPVVYESTYNATNTNTQSYTMALGITLYPLTGRNGYDFVGWYDNANCQGDAVTSVPAGSTGPKQFWAKWAIINYNITYNNLQGATNTNPATYTIEDDIEFVAATGRDGYTFAGWYDNQEFTGEAIVGTQHGSTYGNLNLYANWTANQYTIYFNSNGGSEVANKTQAYGSNVTAPENPTRDGYTFAGWFSGNNQQEFPMTMPLGGATFVAHWTANQYTATILRYDGTEYGSQTYHTGEIVEAPEGLPRDGYTFTNWLVTVGDGYWADMVGDYLPAGADTSQETDTVYGNITLQATYTANQYTATILRYDGTEYGSQTYHTGDVVVAPEGLPRDYYTFTYWLVTAGDGYWADMIGDELPEGADTSLETDTVYGNITLKATYTANEMQINYYLNADMTDIVENTNPANYTVESDFNFVAPTRQTSNGLSYTFVGWYSDSELETPITGISAGTHTQVNAYAKWEMQVSNAADLATAVADANIAEIKLGDDFTATSDVLVSRDLIIDLNNHTITFTGWGFEAREGATLTINGNGAVVAAEACLYAQYTGHIVVNGGTYTSTENFVVGTNGTAGRGGNTIVINGGTFNGDMCEPGRADGYTACGVYIANNDTVTINAGTFNITNGAGVIARSGSTTVGENVVFNVTGDGTLGKVGDSNVVIPTGEELVLDLAANYIGGVPTLTNNTAYNVYTVNP